MARLVICVPPANLNVRFVFEWDCVVVYFHKSPQNKKGGLIKVIDFNSPLREEGCLQLM